MIKEITCPECNKILAIPKYKKLPWVYQTLEFEFYGDKSKIYDFTDNATFIQPARIGFPNGKYLVNLGCTCGWSLEKTFRL